MIGEDNFIEICCRINAGNIKGNQGSRIYTRYGKMKSGKWVEILQKWLLDSQMNPDSSDIVVLCRCVVMMGGRSRDFSFGKIPQVS